MVASVLVACDHAIIRRGLILMISAAADVQAEEVGCIDELFRRLRSDDYGAIVICSSLSREPDVLPRLKAGFRSVPILIFNPQCDDDIAAMHALRGGAAGYIDASSSPEDMLEAIRRLHQGGTYVGHRTAERIAADLARGEQGEQLHEKLSRRELEIFRLLGSGKSVGEIARRLKISVKTVSTHRTRILEKTGMRNNADIIRYAILNRLLT